jgi:methylenetetrahydrofolate reductase (NADPH)
LDDKECIWARAYHRLKFYGETQTMLDGPPVIGNPGLEGTSAWANTYLGRDHFAHAADAEAEDEATPLIPTPHPTKKDG